MFKKGYLQISFAWMFAIIAGIVILSLAFFMVSKIINSGQTNVNAVTAKEIEVLLNPLETGFESGQTTSFTLASGTRINNECEEFGSFGKQIISVSQKSFNKYTDTDIDVGFENKYIFSDRYIEGKKFYLHSKPFEFPFKVADLIFLTSKEYCFLNVPEEIKNDIPSQDNIKTTVSECSQDATTVCFSESGKCDIQVYYSRGEVKKDGETLYFTGNLIYGAIFSDPEIYECQTKRLMKRTSQLASLYWDKSRFLVQKECSSEIDSDLLGLINSLKDFENSEELSFSESYSNILENRNEQRGRCQLW